MTHARCVENLLRKYYDRPEILADLRKMLAYSVSFYRIHVKHLLREEIEETPA